MCESHGARTLVVGTAGTEGLRWVPKAGSVDARRRRSAAGHILGFVLWRWLVTRSRMVDVVMARKSILAVGMARLEKRSTLVAVVGVLAGRRLVVAKLVLPQELLGTVVVAVAAVEGWVGTEMGGGSPSGWSRKTTSGTCCCCCYCCPLQFGVEIARTRGSSWAFESVGFLFSLTRIALIMMIGERYVVCGCALCLVVQEVFDNG
jgi:hypothetical protein